MRKKSPAGEIHVPYDIRFEAINRRLQERRADARVVVEAEMARRLPPRPEPVDKEPEEWDADPETRPHLTRMAMKAIASRAPDQPFGPLWLTGEVNRLFGNKLRKPIAHRQMADVLRRLARKGAIRQVREGRINYEPRFVRVE